MPSLSEDQRQPGREAVSIQQEKEVRRGIEWAISVGVDTLRLNEERRLP